jgi:hypothetical protein
MKAWTLLTPKRLSRETCYGERETINSDCIVRRWFAYIAAKDAPIKAAPNVLPRSICGKRLCVEEDIMDRADSARSKVTLGGCYIPANNEAGVITLVPPICYYVISIMMASICMMVWCSKVSRSEAVFHLKF